MEIIAPGKNHKESIYLYLGYGRINVDGYAFWNSSALFRRHYECVSRSAGKSIVLFDGKDVVHLGTGCKYKIYVAELENILSVAEPNPYLWIGETEPENSSVLRLYRWIQIAICCRKKDCWIVN